jgi:hypothetical protein
MREIEVDEVPLVAGGGLTKPIGGVEVISPPILPLPAVVPDPV